jgi:hypothetical protein
VVLIGEVSSLNKIVRRGLAVLSLAAVVVACDNSTTLVVTVDVRDNSVPHFTQLVIKISSVADPSRELSQMFISTAPGYGAEGGLPAISVPQQDTFTIEPSYLSGPVLVEAQGLEIYSGAVLASGSANADIVAQQKSGVTVTLHGLGATCAAEGGVTDACDGGMDGAARD